MEIVVGLCEDDGLGEGWAEAVLSWKGKSECGVVVEFEFV